MQIRMVALDLDGTLFHEDKSISPYTIEVLGRCQEQGVAVVFATARSEKSSERMTAAIPPDAMISNGGALVRRGGEVLYSRIIPQKLADEILLACVEHPQVGDITVEAAQGYYSTFPDAGDAPQWRDYAHGIHTDFKNGLGQDCYKITPEFLELPVMDTFARRFPQVDVIAFSGENWGRFAHPEATKWRALEAVAQAFGIRTDEIAAFGDDTIDLEMIAKCGMGVAVDNAVDAVKEVADTVCPSNDQDGPARWIDEHIMGSKG